MAWIGRSTLYVVSVGAHIALGGFAARVRVPEDRTPTTITMRETHTRRARPTPPTPAPIPEAPTPAAPARVAPAQASRTPAPVQRAARTAPSPPSARTPPPTSAPAPSGASGDGIPDLGISMAGGIGGNGATLPSGTGPAGGEAPHTTHAAPPPPAHHADECTEEMVRAHPIEMPQPEFPDEAREAGIEGRVRVEITVDATGNVRSARVIQGLGHGLDEAALEAARHARFDAATRCGHAVESTFTIGIRFTL